MKTMIKYLTAIGLSFLAMVGGVNHILIDSMPKDVHPYYLSTPEADINVTHEPVKYSADGMQVTVNVQDAAPAERLQ